MNEFAKTGVALGAAAALTVLAVFSKPGEVRLNLDSDLGEPFFPQLESGDNIAELQVQAYDAEASLVRPFAVKRDQNGVWTIPSSGNYPADATDQMGKAAAMLVGLTKQAVVGDEKGRHVEYGVVDPLAEGAETAGRGKRITVKDSAGNVLADLIVGKEVEGKTGTFYVRAPQGKRVYKTKLAGKLSTSFSDWIETDLLQAKSWNIQKVVFDNYAVDDQRGQIVPGDKYVLARGSDNQYQLEGLAETEETNTTKANEIGTTLGEIKIVGVRPKPEGLTARLERANGIEAQFLADQLARRGFFLGRGGKLWSREGDLVFETKSGVRYTLRFGALVSGDDDEVDAGIGSEQPKDGEEPKKTTANNRYLMVTAEFVEELLDKPTGERIAADELEKRTAARKMIESIQAAVDRYKAAHDDQLPASLAVLLEKPAEGEPLLAEIGPDPWGGEYRFAVEGDGYVVSSGGADGAPDGAGAAEDVRSDRLAREDELSKAAQEWTAYDKKVTTGQEEAAKLTKRFGPWYYVIDKSLFDKLKPARADLVQPKAAEEDGNGDESGK